jgi:DNA-directed RNA polymerase
LLNRKTTPVFNLPSKLPMVCLPKDYTRENKGGYLLNSDKYTEDIFIEKVAYKQCSQLKTDEIYGMVNKISSTPYKVNTELLNYINMKGVEQGLIMDYNSNHELELLDRNILKPFQKRKLASYNSHIILQETILGIADLYKNFPKFYFPFRLDQRGRVYCTSNYFNYQSNGLAKSLLLFADPSKIKKTDTESIEYLISYGVNCFGGTISKQSLNKKLEWANTNKQNIIEYDNGILLEKAKDKLLFLAFCIEYKRYVEFMNNEDVMEFYTYLPVQLDATCNGFQHMALLSNEDILFKELNLNVSTRGKTKDKDKNNTEDRDSIPSDFYNFLLHKIIDVFRSKVEDVKTDPKDKASYERLLSFTWDRAFVKKAIMTIPYNASARSMGKYIKDSLVCVYKDNEDVYWWSYSEKNKKNKVNYDDINLLVTTLKSVINNDFEKIKKLTKYLKNIASVLTSIGLPIVWNLPTGLSIRQSYLETKSTTITPFIHSKVKLNLRTSENKLDRNKQSRSLMPNLIHSLDATSMSLLHKQFSSIYGDQFIQLYSVHDCFGTTCDKVFVLKTILASVYTDLYSSNQYLLKFDNCILDSIENQTDLTLDRNKRTVINSDGKKFILNDVEWVINNKYLSPKEVRKIDMQHILI